MKLIHREVRENFDEPVEYSKFSEDWEVDKIHFYYYKFHTLQQQFTLEVVSWDIFHESQFNCSGPSLWVGDIKPIALVHYGEELLQRIYGTSSHRDWIEFLTNYSGKLELGEYLATLYRVFPNNEQNTPQAVLERLIRVHKPDQWSWEKITDLIYENITKARDVFLGYVRQIPNENIAKVIGDLELTKSSHLSPKIME